MQNSSQQRSSVQIFGHGFEVVSVQERQHDRYEREAKEEGEHEQPLGFGQILLGVLLVTHVVILLGQAGVDDGENTCQRETPATQYGEYVDISDVAVADIVVVHWSTLGVLNAQVDVVQDELTVDFTPVASIVASNRRV